MHKLNLELFNSTIKITSKTDSQFGVYENLAWTYDPVTDFLTFTLNKPFTIGNNYSFEASYKGLVNTDQVGIYKSFYTDNDGSTKWIIASQMEYIEARKAFVCFDEPGFKSVYRIRIIYDKSFTTVLSNNRANNTEK
jgi:aminopeptidase N